MSKIYLERPLFYFYCCIVYTKEKWSRSYILYGIHCKYLRTVMLNECGQFVSVWCKIRVFWSSKKHLKSPVILFSRKYVDSLSYIFPKRYCGFLLVKGLQSYNLSKLEPPVSWFESGQMHCKWLQTNCRQAKEFFCHF